VRYGEDGSIRLAYMKPVCFATSAAMASGRGHPEINCLDRVSAAAAGIPAVAYFS